MKIIGWIAFIPGMLLVLIGIINFFKGTMGLYILPTMMFIAFGGVFLLVGVMLANSKVLSIVTMLIGGIVFLLSVFPFLQGLRYLYYGSLKAVVLILAILMGFLGGGIIYIGRYYFNRKNEQI